ncbi:G patch domain and ankyrin repeat-containing protein 1 homolog [Plodia interpunctella]|uniref:G patch domain and ankyrin repeat-containing protein 1 homolog n=1 Tax=Plodia interpunctella TaxID=58824 RepID=UPI00236881C1|nr:G patch domain and ankyrin repeat-containing protein 1 homolog [Plodia interpunctella]
MLTMYKKDYSNFVRPSQNKVQKTYSKSSLTGAEAKRIYLEEVQEANISTKTANTRENFSQKGSRKCKGEQVNLSNKELFLTVQCDDVDILKQALDEDPDKISVKDEYGWSLLMIACQANSVESVKELLKRDIDTSVRDKAGNSAQSLVIKNKNVGLADLLLSYKHKKVESFNKEHKNSRVKIKEEYVCETCGSTKYPDRDEHLSSTIHNINASKGKKIPTSYVIPQSNKGYQMMLRVGWDKNLGLGPDGSGKKYPIRTVQKKDRKGLGNKRNKPVPQEEQKQSKISKSNLHDRNTSLEIKFRREFY